MSGAKFQNSMSNTPSISCRILESCHRDQCETINITIMVSSIENKIKKLFFSIWFISKYFDRCFIRVNKFEKCIKTIFLHLKSILKTAEIFLYSYSCLPARNFKKVNIETPFTFFTVPNVPFLLFRARR